MAKIEKKPGKKKSKKGVIGDRKKSSPTVDHTVPIESGYSNEKIGTLSKMTKGSPRAADTNERQSHSPQRKKKKKKSSDKETAGNSSSTVDHTVPIESEDHNEQTHTSAKTIKGSPGATDTNERHSHSPKSRKKKKKYKETAGNSSSTVDHTVPIESEDNNEKTHTSSKTIIKGSPGATDTNERQSHSPQRKKKKKSLDRETAGNATIPPSTKEEREKSPKKKKKKKKKVKKEKMLLKEATKPGIEERPVEVNTTTKSAFVLESEQILASRPSRTTKISVCTTAQENEVERSRPSSWSRDGFLQSGIPTGLPSGL